MVFPIINCHLISPWVFLIINCHLVSPQEAKNIIDIGETKGLNHFGSPHLPQTVGLRATGVHYQWLP